jgi:hypothetical protein
MLSRNEWNGRRRWSLRGERAKLSYLILPLAPASPARIGSKRCSVWEDAVALSRALRVKGIVYADVTSGGIPTRTTIPVQIGYQVRLASRVRVGTGMVT